MSVPQGPRRAILLFLLFVFGLSSIFYFLIVSTGKAPALFITGLMWCPGLGAILACLVLGRKLSSLGWGWRPSYQLAAYLIPIAYCLVASTGTWISGLGGFPNGQFVQATASELGWQHLPTWLVIALYVLLTGTTGMVTGLALALGEEIGWRGFLVPELAKTTTLTGTALISGAVWAVWHYPITPIVYAGWTIPTWYWMTCFTSVAIVISFALAWLRLKSGSLWPCAFLHASHNLFMQQIFTPLTSDTGPTKYVAGDLGAALSLSLPWSQLFSGGSDLKSLLRLQSRIRDRNLSGESARGKTRAGPNDRCGIVTSLRYHCSEVSLITVSGEPGSRHEEVARLAAQRLEFELITNARLNSRISEEFPLIKLPEDAWPHVATSMLARFATEQHLLISCDGAERLFPNLREILRVRITAPEAVRVGALMIDRNLDRAAAKEALRQIDHVRKKVRSAKAFDLVLNAQKLTTDQLAEILAETARIAGVKEAGLLPFATEAQMQFQARLELAGHGIAPPEGVVLRRRYFSHPSEEVFANLLDFYRIAWEYEPRSFPIEWNADGRVVEAFTPDFYLPEFDTYVELTTMKQSLVTKKNRKVKKLKALYPGVNIQVFYEKDFANLAFKYGLRTEPVTTV